jgi:hypothetical protein|nr:MAG TPA: hypothetical protein [Bacteriophage sp.]
MQYCLRHWMSDDWKPGSAEQRIKRFLDGCAYLLLRDGPGDTLTEHEEMKHRGREISVSSCPAWVGGLLDAGSYSLENAVEEKARFQCLLDRLDAHVPRRSERKKQKKRGSATRFQRLQSIRERHPGCIIHIVSVDTDNCFVFGGRRFCISEQAVQYAPRQTREGELYDMDRVLIVESGGKPVMFLDQSACLLDTEYVQLCEKK